jgi:hypothetical protein
MKRSPRPSKTLSDSLQQRLNSYVLAASATGVAMFDKTGIGCGLTRAAAGLGMLVFFVSSAGASEGAMPAADHRSLQAEGVHVVIFGGHI